MKVIGWQRTIDRVWKDLVAQAREVAHVPASATLALTAIGGEIEIAVLVKPAESRRAFASLAGAIDRATAHVAKERAAEERPGPLALINMGNSLDCVGCALAETTRATFRDWLARSTTSRDDAAVHRHWTTGFAALALDDRATYRGIAGRADVDVLTLTPGETFGFNLQGLLAHLAAAVETGAPLAAVTPAWEELLRNYDTLYESDSLREATLTWIARVVHHRIGGAPLGDVARLLHDDCWRVAGAS